MIANVGAGVFYRSKKRKKLRKIPEYTCANANHPEKSKQQLLKPTRLTLRRNNNLLIYVNFNAANLYNYF